MIRFWSRFWLDRSRESCTWVRHKKIGNYNCISKWRGEGKRHCRFDLSVGGNFKIVYETEEMWLPGLPIWVSTWKQKISIIKKNALVFKLSTLSSHWRGPWRWTSIQQGVEVTSCLWYSAPQPFTKLILGGKSNENPSQHNTEYDKVWQRKKYEEASWRSKKLSQNNTKPDCAHLGQLVHCFKPMVHRLGGVDNMKPS